MSAGNLLKIRTATGTLLTGLVAACAVTLFIGSCTNDHKSLTGPLKGLAHIPAFSISSATQSGATFTTDKDDYSPGETVSLSGNGWQPADVLDIHLTVDPQTHDPVDWTVAADSSGSFTSSYLVQDTDAGTTLTITATSERDPSETATATFTDNGNGSPTACLTSGVSGAVTVGDDGSVNASGVVTVNSASGTSISVTASSGNVISTICIKSGNSTFALGGSGTTANIHTTSDEAGTSQHSIPITTDGNGNTGDHARYGLDLEPSDAFTDCYTVSGMGTSTVTVTKLPDVGTSPNCRNISHIDVFTSPGGGGGGQSAINTEIQYANGTPVPVAPNNHVALGSSLKDVATLTLTGGSGSPSGTLSITFYSGTLSCDNTGTQVGSTTTINFPTTTLTSNVQGPLGAKNYSFKATFTSGNTADYPDQTSDCEPVVVDKATPTLSTEIHNSSHSAVTSVPLGSTVHDKVTVQGVAGFEPTGTVDFTFFGDNSLGQIGGSGLNCSGTGVSAGSGTLTTGSGGASTAESNNEGPLHAGAYGFEASNYSGDDNYNAVAGPSSCEPLTVNKGDVTITTDIHFSSHSPGDGGPPGLTSVTMGATVHDHANVTLSVVISGFTPSVNPTFSLTTGQTCSGSPLSLSGSGGGTWSSGLFFSGAYTTQPSDVANGISFKSSFAGDADWNSTASDCEPLTVASSISDFHYHWLGTSSSNTGTPSGGTGGTAYTCADQSPNAEAPAGPPWTCDNLGSAANVPLSILVNKNPKTYNNYNWFLIHVTVTNNTGDVITSEKVQGGIAANGMYYQWNPITNSIGSQIFIGSTPVPVTGLDPSSGCGSATINLSSAKTQGSGFGNVVTWTISNMANGASCNLYIVLVKNYTERGLQPVTSSWSEQQGGPGSFVGKSPYTGDLLANVQ